MDRPWQLDPIPLLISPAEGAALEAGPGPAGPAARPDPRRPVRPAAAADRAGSCRRSWSSATRRSSAPATGCRCPANRYLHLYAANLGRAADGTILVLGDRTQAPSGAGYALENRIVLSRMLPDVFRDCRVQRLAPFFQAVRDTLQVDRPAQPRQSRGSCCSPRAPTTRPTSSTPSWPATSGYTLVEGGDLTVRDNRVYLKLLGGLQPVDVILRRLDDDYCDPLELRGDSFLGVPGLLQAVRAGNVAMANAARQRPGRDAGARWPTSRRICRELLGEDLKLPSVPTWWCGEPIGLRPRPGQLCPDGHQAGLRRAPVRARLRRPARRAEQLEELADRIRARPRRLRRPGAAARCPRPR